MPISLFPTVWEYEVIRLPASVAIQFATPVLKSIRKEKAKLLTMNPLTLYFLEIP